MAHKKIKPYIEILRPHQYLKNVLIFTPLFFAGKVMDFPLLLRSAMAFIAFSLTASAVYVINDYGDIEEDREHPVKRTRPLASGKVSKPAGLAVAVLTLFLGLLLSYIEYPVLFIVICIYVLLNVLYTFVLKHISLVDIFVISIGFVLRLVAGSVVTDIRLSVWIVSMTFLLALFLAVAKRREDILLAGQLRKVRKSIDGYNLELVNGAMTIMASVIMVSYIMYTLSAEIIAKFHSNHLYITSVFVLFGILRYMQITFVENTSGSPTLVLIKDRPLQITILAWIISFIFLIY
jgi:decaprenyl-phosphate phosphoribosyltransferase